MKLSSVIPTGLYIYKGAIYYITTMMSDFNLVGKRLELGIAIQGYSNMIQLHANEHEIFTPTILGWLPNDCIPSNVYPELFI